MSAQLLLFDGIPGTGKTTTSRRVAERIRTHGPCGWALEEDPDHPFFPQSIRARHRERNAPRMFLDQWSAVAAACAEKPWVLEGCAFQSTVRFLFEQGRSDEEIATYWTYFATVVSPVQPLLIYLRPSDLPTFLTQHTMEVRSDVWSKISRHVEHTPAGRRLATAGHDPSTEFWIRYAALCDRLVATQLIPTMTADVSNGWAGLEDRVLEVAGADSVRPF